MKHNQRIAAGVVLLALLAASLAWWFREHREHSQDRVIAAAAARYGVDPALVKAVVWRESGFDPAARGRAGELGLMQVTDAAAQEWAEAERVYPLPLEHLLDPATNTRAGTWYLRKLLQRYRAAANPLPFALADYNAGRGNVLKWMKAEAATNDAVFLAQIGFPSTRDYVQAVMERHAHYRGETRLRTAP